MKPAAILLALAALAAVFLIRSPDQETALPLTKSRLRLPSKDAPFWRSAIAQEPLNFREPSAVEIEPSVSIPTDHPAKVARLFRTGDLPALNFALADWFDADPVAARDWLAARESLDPYQPALIRITGQIAEAGDPEHALEWAALLETGPEREQVLFDVYAVAARNHQFTEAQLQAAPLPSSRVDALLSGAAGD
ncbi:MAG: hypothetical protein V4584_02390 [Verrucomicrobiota bacterium]